MPTPPQSSAPRPETPPETSGGIKAPLTRRFVIDAWRFFKARRRDASLRLRPEIARRRAALRADWAARLRALAESRP
ncbi:MAG: hypothetical protein H0T41_06190, partial [Rhodobacteraceae bacterium]|nr:hypothetical protein [Paracoccaceae bacterium]